MFDGSPPTPMPSSTGSCTTPIASTCEENPCENSTPQRTRNPQPPTDSSRSASLRSERWQLWPGMGGNFAWNTHRSGAAVSGLMVAVALAFPPIIPLAVHLAIPLAVMGFCTVGHKAVRLGVGWYEVLREPCARQAPSTFKPVLALPPPTRDQESIVDQLARLEGARAV